MIRSRRLKGPTSRRLSLPATFALLAIACNTSDGVHPGGRPGFSDAGTSATENASSDGATSGTEHPPCKTKCGVACGGEDGCGGTCACAPGKDCRQGVCIDPACGPCRPNEVCSGGQCQCQPSCDGRACQADGCGGTCPCPPDLVVNAQGRTVSVTDCKDTCKGSGWSCGTLCGVDCGSCVAGKACKLGACVCAPKCDGTSCSDGCGGTCACAAGTVCDAANQCVVPEACHDTCESTGKTCGSICAAECGACGDGQSCIDGQCREGVSCRDCALQLRLIDRQVIDQKIVRVKLGVEVSVADDNSGPRLMDVRVLSDKVVQLVDATAGPALYQTGKDLFVDESTHTPWQQRGDQSYQLLAYSVSGTLRVSSGRVMTLTFDLAEPGPVNFSLVRHTQTFAPLDADSALQVTAYDQPLAVSQ